MMNGDISFLGLGLMGAPMARRLAQAGLSPRVWNRSAEKAKALRRYGARPAATPAEAVSGCMLILLCLRDAAALEAALFGPAGAAGAAEEGALFVDLSTTSPAAAREFAARLRRRWLDCPISGGVGSAEAGTLTIMAGGAAEDLDQARPVLERLGSRITHMGPTGCGQAAKLCNQLIVSANLLAIAEAITLGERLGIDAGSLPHALAGGFADSRPLQAFGPRMALESDPGPPASAIGTMRKDVAAIRSAAEQTGTPLPLFGAVSRLYDRAAEQGLDQEDLPSLIRLYRQQAEG